MRTAIFILLFLVTCVIPARSTGQDQQSSDGEKRLSTLNDQANSAASPADIKRLGEQLSAEALKLNSPYWEAMGHHHTARAFATEGALKESLLYRRKAIRLFEKMDRPDKVSRQLLNYGNVKANLAEYDSAMHYFERGLALAQQSNDTLSITGALLNISSVHHDLGNREKELEFLLKALDQSKILNDSLQISTIQYNLAIFYLQMGEIDQCYAMLAELLIYYTSVNDMHGLAQVYNLYAQHQFDKNQTDSALFFLDKALENYEKLGDKAMVAFITMNQGSALGKAERWDQSIDKLNNAYDMFVEIGEVRYAATCLHELSASEEEKGNVKEAIRLMIEALKISEEIKSLTNTSRWYKELAALYFKSGKHEEAYNALIKHTELNDSLANMNKQDAIRDMEGKYQNEKKQREIESLEQEKTIQSARLKAERAQRMMLIGGLSIALLLIVIVGFALIQKRRDNKIISEQKVEVERQRDEVRHQKLIVDEKNKEITDSITYAKRIQEAILPPLRIVNDHLENNFILYLPKDIVAGDFYWFEAVGDVVYFAAADCTGHGVPGAMVSVVCSNALNRSVREYKCTEPGKILDQCRTLVIEEFAKSEEDVKDGMDISLCALNTTTNQLQWSGAYNPLWIIRNGSAEIEEYKADKQPIGKHLTPAPFTTHNISLNKGDTLYLFSDGFSDQFGGDNGKKYKSANFKKRIIEISNYPLNEQRKLLEDEFHAWREGMEQLDDVCVIGVRV